MANARIFKDLIIIHYTGVVVTNQKEPSKSKRVREMDDDDVRLLYMHNKHIMNLIERVQHLEDTLLVTTELYNDPMNLQEM